MGLSHAVINRQSRDQRVNHTLRYVGRWNANTIVDSRKHKHFIPNDIPSFVKACHFILTHHVIMMLYFDINNENCIFRQYIPKAMYLNKQIKF